MRLIDPDGCLNALEDCPSNMDTDSVKALTSLWNEGVRQAVDTIAPRS